MLKKIILAFLAAIIIIGIAGFIGYKFLYKRVEGIQDVNSKIISPPKESEWNSKPTSNNESKSPTLSPSILDTIVPSSNKSSISSYLNPKTSNPTINPYKLNFDSTNPNYIDTYNDFLIKQAELDYENSHKEYVAYTEACDEINKQRKEALAPVQTQLDQLQQEMDKFESDLANRTDLTQAQKDRVWTVEGEPLRQRFMDLTTEWLNIYKQYSC